MEEVSGEWKGGEKGREVIGRGGRAVERRVGERKKKNGREEE